MLRRSLSLTVLCAIPAGNVHAEGADIAVLVTGVTTVVIMMALLFVIFVMNANITPLVTTLKALRWKLWSAEYTENKVGVNHNFDGISELDNRIPPWFNYLFLGTVVWGMIYLVNYHILGGKLMADEYQDQIAQAAIERRIILANEGSIDENAIIALKDEASLTAGHDNFQKYCITCHGKDGGGIVGPNLTDQYWIHGGTAKDVYATIKNGVAAKGMISWQLVFTPKQIQQIASYVLSLQGTTPIAGKKPEGTLYVQKPDSVTIAKK